jgi:hypothetical protein
VRAKYVLQVFPGLVTPPRVFTWVVAKLARARPSVTKHVGGLSIFFVLQKQAETRKILVQNLC